MLDYYLPHLQPWDKGSLRKLSTMAAPIHYCPQKMYMYFQRQDDEFCHYSFVNEGGTPFVMTPTNAPRCFHTIDYVKKFEGKPLEVGRVIAIVFHVGSHTTPPWFVIGLSWTADHGDEQSGLLTRQSLLRNEVTASRITSATRGAWISLSSGSRRRQSFATALCVPFLLSSPTFLTTI